MPRLIERPTIIEAAGNKLKRIEEFTGRVNSEHQTVSIMRVRSPAGWKEPGQRPEFEEISIVIEGMLRVEYHGGVFEARAVQAVVVKPGEWVRLVLLSLAVRNILRFVYPHSPPRLFTVTEPSERRLTSAISEDYYSEQGEATPDLTLNRTR